MSIQNSPAWIQSFRQRIPILTYILLAYILKRTHGHLYVNELIFLTIVFVFLLWFTRARSPASHRDFNWVYLILSLLLLDSTELIYAENNQAARVLEFLIDAHIILPLIYCCYKPGAPSKDNFKDKLLWLSWGVIIISLILVPLATPVPHIDVYHLLNQSAENILQGINPYSFAYDGIYIGPPNLVYWPGLLYPALPFKLLGIDVRYAQITSILVTAILFRYFNRNNEQHPHFFLLFMLMPIGLFVLEQSWYDAFLFPYILLLFEGLKRQSVSLSALGLGYLAASRQWNLFVIIFVLVYLWRNYRTAFFFQVCGYTALVSSVLFLPFWLWNFPAFLESTVIQVLSYPPRGDSLSWLSYVFANHNQQLSPFPFMVATIAIGLVLTWRSRTPDRLFLVIFTSHLFFLLTSRQAFCNYYYYFSFYLFLFLAAQFPVRSLSSTA
ncbi:MAG: hypothetical protein AAGG51_08020 [Cyanobacteria bacterium P01_G01_bin.54]